MKLNPGEWLRPRLFGRIADAAFLATLASGWLCGALAAALAMGLGEWLGTGLAIVFVLLPGATLLGAALYQLAKGWRLPDMGKGAHAEETIGQAIGYALTRERCAVAHHVERIARVGDIDHLVATPRGLRVIETKHGRVPSSMFPETLRRIALNVQAVRNCVPGMRVTGCLVFVTGSGKPPKPGYEWGTETIRCFGNAASLMRELKAEARCEGGSSEMARRVWQLGKVGGRRSREAGYSAVSPVAKAAREVSRSLGPFRNCQPSSAFPTHRTNQTVGTGPVLQNSPAGLEQPSLARLPRPREVELSRRARASEI